MPEIFSGRKFQVSEAAKLVRFVPGVNAVYLKETNFNSDMY